jgi:hypothetical protein
VTLSLAPEIFTPDILLKSLKKEAKMSIPLSEAIAELRAELRKAVLERNDQDIIFTPKGIELELGVILETEAKAGGGFKLLALVDLSSEATASRSSAHKVKLILDVTDRDLKPIKILSQRKTEH